MAIDPTKFVRRLVTLQHELDAEISDYRFQNRIVSVAETFRVLLRRGLDAERAATSTPPKAKRESAREEERPEQLVKKTQQ